MRSAWPTWWRRIPARIDTASPPTARRVLRTTRVQLKSRAMGEHVYHPAGPHAALRNAIMRAKSQEQWYDTLEWLYGSTGLDESVYLS